jgi:hypothetical protein
MNYSGYVYLIGTPIFGWYKIGKAKDPKVRVTDLGILLPFKIDVIAVWGAANHHLLEKTLHDIHKKSKINGEWFEFSKDEIIELINSIPETTRISTENNFNLSSFSNIAEDMRTAKTHSPYRGKVLGVKIQKLRGNFTPEEREAKRIAAIEKQKEKKKTREEQKTS